MNKPHRSPQLPARRVIGAPLPAARAGTRLAASALAAVLLLGCTPAAERAPQTPAPAAQAGPVGPAAAQASPVDPAAIQAVLDRAVEQGVASGAIALVSHRGEIIFRGGAGDLDPDAPVAITTSSKPIIAALFVALASDGLLDLDTPISTWLPEWEQVHLRLPSGPAPRAPTVRELLSHTSGIPPLLRPAPPTETLADLSRAVAEGGLRSRPGSRFNYGSVSYDIAAHVAEAVTGRPFDALLEERLLTPLGMNDTRLDGTQVQPARALTAEPLDEPGPDTPTHSGRWVAASGGLSSTLDDLHRFWSLHLPGRAGIEGSPLTEEAMLALRTPTARPFRGTPFGADYGLGHYLDRLDPAGTPRTLSHEGNYGSMPWIDLDRELIAIVVVPRPLVWAMPVILEVRAVLDEAFPPEPADLP
jgi:CubicO group peptidase (beta-lactamase class C family)